MSGKADAPGALRRERPQFDRKEERLPEGQPRAPGLRGKLVPAREFRPAFEREGTDGLPGGEVRKARCIGVAPGETEAHRHRPRSGSRRESQADAIRAPLRRRYAVREVVDDIREARGLPVGFNLGPLPEVRPRPEHEFPARELERVEPGAFDGLRTILELSPEIVRARHPREAALYRESVLVVLPVLDVVPLERGFHVRRPSQPVGEDGVEDLGAGISRHSADARVGLDPVVADEVDIDDEPVRAAIHAHPVDVVQRHAPEVGLGPGEGEDFAAVDVEGREPGSEAAVEHVVGSLVELAANPRDSRNALDEEFEESE